jgi:hypothetical protein
MITEINHEFRLQDDIQDIRVKSKDANKILKGKLRNLRARSTEINQLGVRLTRLKNSTIKLTSCKLSRAIVFQHKIL